ncbi:MAG: TlpA disulfide reductase family protein [Gammaproteobacteria bacterium]
MNARFALIFLLAAGLLTGLVGCDREPQELAVGQWRSVVKMPGGELPFTLDIVNPNGPGVKAYIINGDERVPVTHMQVSDDKVVIDFPAFNNRIEATLKNGRLIGDLTLTKRHGVLQVMPLTMTAGETHRFYAERPDVNADFAGRWRVDFEEDDGTRYEAVADFSQSNGRVTGTFRTPTGDYRFLEGEVSDRTLHLSTFDGAHAFLFDAIMDSDGHIEGNFWSGTEWHESWVAVRDANAELPDANNLTKVAQTGQPFVVEFPDTSGQKVRSDSDAFKNKVLVVALAGSWCPNCHDEAAFLAPFYRQYREQGLEVLGLMYEHLDDFSEAASQVNKFREKFGIEYELLVAGSSDKSRASETLPMLSEVIAYPTMIVLDRTGEVRRVHTGFDGPGTGEKYNEFRREFTAFIEELLNEEQS